jgi:hypothetical protein
MNTSLEILLLTMLTMALFVIGAKLDGRRVKRNLEHYLNNPGLIASLQRVRPDDGGGYASMYVHTLNCKRVRVAYHDDVYEAEKLLKASVAF